MSAYVLDNPPPPSIPLADLVPQMAHALVVAAILTGLALLFYLDRYAGSRTESASYPDEFDTTEGDRS